MAGRSGGRIGVDMRDAEMVRPMIIAADCHENFVILVKGGVIDGPDAISCPTSHYMSIHASVLTPVCMCGIDLGKGVGRIL